MKPRLTKNKRKIFKIFKKLKKEYLDNKLSLEKIAIMYDVKRSTLTLVFKRNGIPLRTNNETRAWLRELGLYATLNNKGENNPNWRGGRSRVKYHGYSEEEYLSWRDRVFKRDNWTCAECGSRNNLNGHHIIPVRMDKSRILDVTNGITLCEPCHEKTYTKEILFVEKFLSLTRNTAKAGV